MIKPTETQGRNLVMKQTYAQMWEECCVEHEGCAYAAWREVTTRNPDGTLKTEEEYCEDLVWAYDSIVEAGGVEGC